MDTKIFFLSAAYAGGSKLGSASDTVLGEQ